MLMTEGTDYSSRDDVCSYRCNGTTLLPRTGYELRTGTRPGHDLVPFQVGPYELVRVCRTRALGVALGDSSEEKRKETPTFEKRMEIDRPLVSRITRILIDGRSFWVVRASRFYNPVDRPSKDVFQLHFAIYYMYSEMRRGSIEDTRSVIHLQISGITVPR